MSCNKKHFCTCRDRECAYNPNNPSGACLSCDECVRKNLENGEIPSCFFRKVKDDLTGVCEFTFESFARFWNENKKV